MMGIRLVILPGVVSKSVFKAANAAGLESETKSRAHTICAWQLFEHVDLGLH
jgi:hypothetical protein